jgi:hypothetical protein
MSGTSVDLLVMPRIEAVDEWADRQLNPSPSVRGRVGFIGWSKTLWYVTGGAAWASTEYNGHMTHYRR